MTERIKFNYGYSPGAGGKGVKGLDVFVIAKFTIYVF